MLRIELIVEDSEEPSGFDMGDLRLTGDAGSCSFHCMIVLSATLLMYQIGKWYVGTDKVLDFNPADQSGLVIFSKTGDGVDVSTRVWSGRQEIDHIQGRALLTEILRACSQLELFVSQLPPGDAGRHDFEHAIRELRDLVRGLPSAR